MGVWTTITSSFLGREPYLRPEVGLFRAVEKKGMGALSCLQDRSFLFSHVANRVSFSETGPLLPYAEPVRASSELPFETSGFLRRNSAPAREMRSPSPCVSLGDENEDLDIYLRLAALGQGEPPPDHQGEEAPVEDPEMVGQDAIFDDPLEETAPAGRVLLIDRFQSPPSPINLERRLLEEDNRTPANQEEDYHENLPAFNAFAPDRDVLHLLPDSRLALRELLDGGGRTIYTQLPIREGLELDYYLSVRFEELEGEATICFPYETEEDELPSFLPAERSYLPFPEVFVGPPATVFRRKLVFLRSLQDWVDKLYSIHPVLRDHLNTQEWKRRLRPRSHLVKFLNALPDDYLPTEEDIAALNRSLGDETRLYTFPLPLIWDEVMWELNTYHFRHDFELLAARLHLSLQDQPEEEKKSLWHTIRYRIRRLWGRDVPGYPSYDEPRYLDHADELIQLKHWIAVGRQMSEWSLPSGWKERISLAQGGNVIEMRLELMEIFSNAFRLEFMRDTYTFYNRLE